MARCPLCLATFALLRFSARHACAAESAAYCVDDDVSLVQTAVSGGLLAHRFSVGLESGDMMVDCKDSHGIAYSKNPDGGFSIDRVCKDTNGRPCTLCLQPAPTFPEYADGFIVRDDCGNQTIGGLLDLDRPLISYNSPPTANFLPPKTGAPTSWTNAWCEMNMQKSCADADANRDYFFYAAGFVVEPGFQYDFYYCKYNGYLEEAFVKNIRNYDALYEQSAAICAARDEEFNISSITQRQMAELYNRDVPPNAWQARWLSAWTCAMGGPGGDIAYCGYTFKELSNGSFCQYPSGPGWKGTIFEGTAEAKKWECPKES